VAEIAYLLRLPMNTKARLEKSVQAIVKRFKDVTGSSGPEHKYRRDKRDSVIPTAGQSSRGGEWGESASLGSAQSDPQAVGHEIVGCFYFNDLLDEERDVAKLFVTGSNRVHLGVINANHLAVMYQNKLALSGSQQLICGFVRTSLIQRQESDSLPKPGSLYIGSPLTVKPKITIQPGKQPFKSRPVPE
jgi:hypothetical protein